MFFGCTMKYGIFVPSFDVAKRWSTASPEASNFGASALTRVSVPVFVSARNSVDGVKYPLSKRNAAAPVLSAAASSTDELSGTLSGRTDQPPFAVGVYTNARPRTLS